MLTATISGSFRRHMDAITSAVQQLAEQSVRVLSPADPRVVAAQGEFLFVASDRLRSVRLVQDRHLESIRASSFLWLVCPDGYVGQSASLEIGFALSQGVPVLSTNLPTDLTLREYVKVFPSLTAAVASISHPTNQRKTPGILIDPRATAEKAHRVLDTIANALTRDGGDPVLTVQRDLVILREDLSLPTYIQ